VHISLSSAIELVGVYRLPLSLQCMMHGQYDANRPTVTFPATEHHRPLAGTKLYCLVTEAYVCEPVCEIGKYFFLGGGH